MSETSLQTVVTQEKAAKPTLNASPGLGAWLTEVGGSLAFTTYQSARLFLLSAGTDGKTNAQERIMGAAMGLAVDNEGMWIANQQQAWRFSDVGPRTLGETAFDAVYMPRKGYFLGPCDAHDILADVSFKGERQFSELIAGMSGKVVMTPSAGSAMP